MTSLLCETIKIESLTLETSTTYSVNPVPGEQPTPLPKPEVPVTPEVDPPKAPPEKPAPNPPNSEPAKPTTLK